jgi:hypothetical protein
MIQAVSMLGMLCGRFSQDYWLLRESLRPAVLFVFMAHRADSDALPKSDCPEKREADGSLRQEWEVALGSGEVLFVPEGWELSMLRPAGTRSAGTQVVAIVRFGWEEHSRRCC